MDNPLVQPDPGLFIWTIVTFLVLVALLAKFAWRPLLRALETRQETISLTTTAALKVSELLASENDPRLFLRVAVQPGGCSGLKYGIWFDEQTGEDDVVIPYNDFDLRVDRMSAPYLRGAKMDWLEGLDRSGFTIDNPNATGSCACGDSFH